jgi:hypothetical protein
MRNSAGSKSPTVRLQIVAPCSRSTRMSAAILRISEPTSPAAMVETGEGGTERLAVRAVARSGTRMRLGVARKGGRAKMGRNPLAG